MPLFCRRTALAVALTAGIAGAGPGFAQNAEFQITYANGAFEPASLTVPAGKPIVLKVRNNDAKAIEFESNTMKVEKVIAAKSEAVINVRALKAGSYEFFNEFNEKARGKVVAQ